MLPNASLMKTSVLAASCAVGLWNVSAQVTEQRPTSPSAVMPVPHGAAPIQDEKLDQYSDAYLRIEAIRKRAQADLAKTDDPARASEIKAKAEARIIEAVARSGLKLDEFNRIAELAKVDDGLREELADRIEKRRRSSD